jgi:hypothetical protein
MKICILAALNSIDNQDVPFIVDTNLLPLHYKHYIESLPSLSTTSYTEDIYTRYASVNEAIENNQWYDKSLDIALINATVEPPIKVDKFIVIKFIN